MTETEPFCVSVPWEQRTRKAFFSPEQSDSKVEQDAEVHRYRNRIIPRIY